VNHILRATVHEFILLNRGRLCLVRGARASVVEVPLDSRYNVSDSAGNDRHAHLDYQRDLDLQTCVDEPHWHVVVVRALEELGDMLWEMLRQVSVDEQHDEASIGELTNKDAPGDSSFLGT